MPISRIVFAGQNASGNANLGVTTRTSAGTSELAVAGANAGGLFNSNKFPSGFTPGFTVLGNRALFEGDDASGAASLWVTDGTSAGTSELIVAGSDASGLFTNVIAPHLTVVRRQGALCRRRRERQYQPVDHRRDGRRHQRIGGRGRLRQRAVLQFRCA